VCKTFVRYQGLSSSINSLSYFILLVVLRSRSTRSRHRLFPLVVLREFDISEIWIARRSDGTSALILQENTLNRNLRSSCLYRLFNTARTVRERTSLPVGLFDMETPHHNLWWWLAQHDTLIILPSTIQRIPNTTIAIRCCSREQPRQHEAKVLGSIKGPLICRTASLLWAVSGELRTLTVHASAKRA
jgi:hypothetical protein